MALPYQGKDEARRQGKVWTLETCQLNRRYHHTQIQKLVSSSGALPFKKNPFPISSTPTEAAFEGSHLGWESCVCWERIQSSPTSREKAQTAQHSRGEEHPSNL